MIRVLLSISIFGEVGRSDDVTALLFDCMHMHSDHYSTQPQAPEVEVLLVYVERSVVGIGCL